MNGPRILLVVGGVMVAILWMALVGDEDADLERGLEETGRAFARVEEELAAMEPIYAPLARRGLMLALKSEHDAIRTGLAELKARRLRLRDDTTGRRRDRLPALRELVVASDELLARAKSLHARVSKRHAFITESSPLLTENRALRDEILGLAAQVTDDGLRARASALAGRFAELEQSARATDTLLHRNVQQGEVMGGATLSGLRELRDELLVLRGELEAAVGR